LSDVYAMGGECISALNIVAFPVKRLPMEILERILLGAQEKANEAGVSIIGGHSIEDNEPKFGMCVTGIVHPKKIWRNRGCQEGDILLLTKPIGTGIITTAIKRKMVDSHSSTARKAIESMSQLNKYSCDIFKGKSRHSPKQNQPYSIHACTDITGFGLLGHIKGFFEKDSIIYAEIESQNVPLLDEAYELALSDIIPGGTINNVQYVENITEYSKKVSDIMKYLLCDAQTSGGLLVSVPESEYEEIMNNFAEQNQNVWKIGCIKSKSLSKLLNTTHIYIS